MASRLFRVAVVLAVLVACLGAAWRLRHKLAHGVARVERVVEAHGLANAAPTPDRTPLPVGPHGTLQLDARPAGSHPRILLTPDRLALLAAHKAEGTPGWTVLFSHCQKVVAGDWTGGYESWDWANAVPELALCARLTHDPTFEAAAIKYFTALLDDRERAGDGKGGDDVVTHDEGYGIRTHGCFGAIAYDWLHDAHGMTPALRKHAMDRFVSWTTWFKAHGYNADNAISNYFAGYFCATAMAGIAAQGDDPRADALLHEAQSLWNDRIVPTFRTKLAGGDFPEGWQYADLVGAVLAAFADVEGPQAFTDLPWLHEVVRLRAFALRPDGMHTYDNGDWNDWPPWAPTHTLEMLAIVLPKTDPANAQAEFLARLARDPRDSPGDDWRWLFALSEDPHRRVEDPRAGQRSYLATGTAEMFARSSFAPGALWVSLTSEPSLSDHEHLDAGHFELWRGANALFIDGGAYGSYSSLSHNVVIVDDPEQSPDWETSKAHNDVIRYKRNQGTWSDTANIARFDDGGGYAYALADYASAFNPRGWPERRDRSVTRAERELLFSRAPVASAGQGETGRLVVYDRFTLSAPRFTTTFVLHGGPIAPRIAGPVAFFKSGDSGAWVTTLLPAGAVASVVDETHNKESDDKPYFNNYPPRGVTSFRYEVAQPASAASSIERRFLHAVVVGSAAASPAPSASITGDGVAGAVIESEAYVFSASGPSTRAAPVAYVAPRTATHHIVADLAPSAPYGVEATAQGDACKVTLAPGGSRAASAGGVLAFDLGAGCALSAPH
jgi:hypothetical protein